MTNSEKTFLVTGGAGFLGSHLVDKLLQLEYRVVCFDDESRGNFANIENKNSNKLVKIKGDIRKIQDWPSNEKISGLFHLGAINGTLNFYSIPETVLEVNVKGIINALEFARKNEIEYFAFASSPEAYGIPKVFPTPETESLHVPDLDNPRWSYGGSKIIGELYCSQFAKKYGFKCSILRYHNTYGPRDFSGHVIPDLLTKILNNEKLQVEGTGEETRSFCFVSDTIDATLLVYEKQKLPVDIFNIGFDKETKISHLIDLLLKITGKKTKPIFIPKDKAGTNRRLPDISKLKKLGYTPKIPLEEGLQLTYDWFKSK